jgi:hypothetical protein
MRNIFGGLVGNNETTTTKIKEEVEKEEKIIKKSD